MEFLAAHRFYHICLHLGNQFSYLFHCASFSYIVCCSIGALVIPSGESYVSR